MGLGKIIAKLRNTVIPNEQKLKNIGQNKTIKFNKVGIFAENSVQQNRKLVAGIFLVGATAGGFMYKNLNSQNKIDERELEPKIPSQVYKVCGYGGDTLTFESSQSAKNFERLYKKLEMESTAKRRIYLEEFLPVTKSKVYKDYKQELNSINQEYDKKRVLLEDNLKKRLQEIDSVKVLQRNFIEKKFKKEMESLKAEKRAKIEQVEEKFDSTSEGHLYNSNYALWQEERDQFFRQYEVLKKMCNNTK